MTGKTHIAIGIATALTLSKEQPIENKIIIVLASIIGSLAPDIDHPRAQLNQKLLRFKNNLFKMIFYLSFAGLFVTIYYRHDKEVFLLAGLAFFLIGVSGHRGFTHSLLGFLAANILVKLLSSKYGLESIYIGFSTGYAMHLLADYFNPRGIKLFYPIDINVSAPLTIKTGKSSEKIIFMLTSFYSMALLMEIIKI